MTRHHMTLNGPVPFSLEEEVERDILEEQANAKQIIINKEIGNKIIKEELTIIDMKSIRAIRENDTKRIEKLEAEAVVLREQLIKE